MRLPSPSVWSSLRTAFLSAGLLLAGSSCGDSTTVKQIEGFATKVCACTDATCAKKVEMQFLTWQESQKRARGTEEDRKAVETAMERYAKCHIALIGPEAAPPTKAIVPVPKVNLAPTTAPAATLAAPPAPAPATKTAPPTPAATLAAPPAPAPATKTAPTIAPTPAR